jgi:hypothetical protein
LPEWWEQLYDLSDSNSADALGDGDGDGVSNEDEYSNRANPEQVDTDGDGLNDYQEIVTCFTDAWRTDSDDDGLSDQAEIVTHQSDPRDADSDDDGYTDFDEVLYGGDPNDGTGLPQPLEDYAQSFEATPDLAAWTTPDYSFAPWAIDSTVANSGAASLKSGSIANSQNSSIRFRGVFTAGQLSFSARVDSQNYSGRLKVLVDGTVVRELGTSNQWYRHSIPIALGAHTIEWRFEKEFYAQSADAAYIDDVLFVRQ